MSCLERAVGDGVEDWRELPLPVAGGGWAVLRMAEGYSGSIRLVVECASGRQVTLIVGGEGSLRPFRIPSDARLIRTIDEGSGEVALALVGRVKALALLLRQHLTDGKLASRVLTAMRLLAHGDLCQFALRFQRGHQEGNLSQIFAETARRPRLPVAGKPVAVAAFSHSLAVEGAPLSLLELCAGLIWRGDIKPTVFAPSAGPLLERWRAVGARWMIWGPPQAARLVVTAYEQAVSDLAKRLVDTGTELVIANTLRSFLAVDAADQAGISCIWILRESDPWWSCFDDFGEEVRLRAYACLIKADRIVFVSSATRKLWDGVLPRSDLVTIPNRLMIDPGGRALRRLETRRALGLTDDDVVALSVGVISELKGQLDILAALPLIPPANRLRVVLIGRIDDRIRGRFEVAVADLPPALATRLTVLPPTDDPQRYFEAADIFLLPSRSESYPRVILEAMAHGLAILASPVFGVTEQLMDGESGMFIAAHDVKGLASAITALVDDSDKRRRLGSGARRAFAALSSFDEMVSSYSRLIAQTALDQPDPVGEEPLRSPEKG